MITRENYFCVENNTKYMGSTQFKAFDTCESAALAGIKGEYAPEVTTPLLVGSYVDAHFEGTLDLFKAKNPNLFTRQGELKAEFKHAETIIQRVSRDEMFMRYMAGEKQVVKTGEISGIPFKIRMDSYHPGKCIVDLKIVKDFSPVWVDGQGKLPFVEAWGYDFQAAIYQAIEGNKLPFFIAAATKEKPEPDIAVISIPQHSIDVAMEIILSKVERFQAVKQGLIEPNRCERCNYCKMTKVLTDIVSYEEVGA